MGKLGVVGAGEGAQLFQVGPPPPLDGLALRGKLGVEHFQQGRLFGVGPFRRGTGMAQQRIFLLQCPDIAAVDGQVAGVELAQGSIQKFPASLRGTFDKAQVSGVEDDGREAACQCRRPFGRGTVHGGVPPRPGGIRHPDGHPDAVRRVRFLLFLLCPEGGRFQHGEGFAPPHQFSVLAAPEALSTGQQPDGFQQVGLALAVVAADDGQLPARRQAGRGDVAIILDFQ